MKQLKYLNICYDSQEINSKLKEFIYSYPNNFITYNNHNELIEIINRKNVHLVITKYNYDLLKQIKQLNNQINVIAILDEINNTHLLESLEIKDIKLIQDLNMINEFIETLESCIKNIDSNKSNILHLEDDFIYDNYNKTLFKNDIIIPLSKKESSFLNYLISNKSKAVSYNEINANIWEGSMTQDALRSLIKELRKKTYKELIKNVSGIGYRIDL